MTLSPLDISVIVVVTTALTCALVAIWQKGAPKSTDPHACPKCGGSLAFPVKREYVKEKFPSGCYREFIKCACSRCGYGWEELCKDSRLPKDLLAKKWEGWSGGAGGYKPEWPSGHRLKESDECHIKLTEGTLGRGMNPRDPGPRPAPPQGSGGPTPKKPSLCPGCGHPPSMLHRQECPFRPVGERAEDLDAKVEEPVEPPSTKLVQCPKCQGIRLADVRHTDITCPSCHLPLADYSGPRLPPNPYQCAHCGKHTGIGQGWEAQHNTGRIELHHAGSIFAYLCDGADGDRGRTWWHAGHPAMTENGAQKVVFEWGSTRYTLCRECHIEIIKGIGRLFKIPEQAEALKKPPVRLCCPKCAYTWEVTRLGELEVSRCPVCRNVFTVVKIGDGYACANTPEKDIPMEYRLKIPDIENDAMAVEVIDELCHRIKARVGKDTPIADTFSDVLYAIIREYKLDGDQHMFATLPKDSVAEYVDSSKGEDELIPCKQHEIDSGEWDPKVDVELGRCPKCHFHKEHCDCPRPPKPVCPPNVVLREDQDYSDIKKG